MGSTSLDEIIIDFVREDKCIYDKSHPNFKNICKKKEIWQKISENLKNLYHIDMSAETIEKRWSSLRDMFSRENRKKKLAPSGSAYEPIKEWELYRNMLFLLPHIAHRRTKSSFVPLNQSITSLSKLSPPKENDLLPLKESNTNIIYSPSSYEHEYNEPNTFFEDNRQLPIDNEETVISIDEIQRPASVMSTCSNTSSIQFLSTSSSSQNLKSSHLFKPIKKRVPEMDNFAKRRKNKDDRIDQNLAEASSVISTAVKTISSQFGDQRRKLDGYMSAIQEGIDYVSGKNKTQCLIEVLQIIQKYEERP